MRLKTMMVASIGAVHIRFGANRYYSWIPAQRSVQEEGMGYSTRRFQVWYVCCGVAVRARFHA